MEMKFTPGPWTVTLGRGFVVNQIVQRIGDSTGENVIADVRRWMGAPEEAEANAKLIAAAPELLEALISFLRAPSVGSDGPGSSMIVIQDYNRKVARVAIAKATE